MRRENSNSCRKQKGFFFSVVLGRVECIYGSRREARESRGKRAKVLDPPLEARRGWIKNPYLYSFAQGKTPSKI